jgi:hypothetical protein
VQEEEKTAGRRAGLRSVRVRKRKKKKLGRRRKKKHIPHTWHSATLFNWTPHVPQRRDRADMVGQGQSFLGGKKADALTRAEEKKL